MSEEKKSGKITPEDGIVESKDDICPIEKEKNTNKTTESCEKETDIPSQDCPPITNEEYNQDLKERMENNSGFKVINFQDLLNKAPDYAIWLKTICRYGNVDNVCLLYYDYKNGETWIKTKFYTNDHIYNISVHLHEDKEDHEGYLGCTVSTRKPRPGEDWTRGNDLPDGKYNKKTWNKIVNRILGYEMKTLQLWR